MPLRRTPPGSPLIQAPNEPMTNLSASNPAISHSLQHCASEPDLNVTRSVEELDRQGQNITQRHKRKRLECSTHDQLSGFMEEMRSMFSELKDHQLAQDAKMEKISQSIDEIKTQNISMQAAADFLANKFDTIQAQIGKLESDRNSNLHLIQELEGKLELLERHKRATCVEIRNLPYTTGETKQSLLSKIINVTSTLNITIDQHCVRDIFRVNKGDSNDKTIIVDFTSTLTKELVIRKYKEYNKINRSNKLNTETLRISGPRKPIFISENLTPKMKRLLYLSKEFGRSNSFAYCWVSHGKIFLRKKDGSAVIPVKCELDLTKLKDESTL